jgi:uncharacterized protein YlbG (UPF0298 family)
MFEIKYFYFLRINWKLFIGTRDGIGSVRTFRKVGRFGSVRFSSKKIKSHFYIEHKHYISKIDKTLQIWLNMFVSNVKSGLLKEIESKIMRKYDLNQDLRARKK